MLMRWCDPVLVAAVRAAEATFTEDQVIATVPCSLGGAAPAVPDPPDLDFNAKARIKAGLGPSWYNLLDDLRSRIMISRIELAGIPASDPRAIPVNIPPSYVNCYEFDFRTDTVSSPVGVWSSVTATLTTEACATDDDTEGPLPLTRAMLTYCDDALVDHYETADMADRLAAEIRADRLHPDRWRRYAGVSMFDIDRVERPWKARLEPAKEQLLADFRARIASSAIELTGLQIEPLLAGERRPLSAAWAERMHFDLHQQSVRVEGYVFVDVVAKAMPPRLGVPGEVASGKTKASRGRPRFPMAKMIAIARDDPDLNKGPKKRRANYLVSEFTRLHPSSDRPAYRTILDHANKIYAAAATDAAPLKPLK